MLPPHRVQNSDSTHVRKVDVSGEYVVDSEELRGGWENAVDFDDSAFLMLKESQYLAG